MEPIAKGKVRDIYDIGKYLVMVSTDRISAFDVILPSTIPNKGAVLNRLSEFWFDSTKVIIPNHMVSIENLDMPAYFQTRCFLGRCMLVKKLKMLPIECIVRGYITGSGWASYQKSASVCGIELPAGLRESEALPEPIYTPTTKAIEGHDEHISFEQTANLIGTEMATKVMEASLRLYTVCAEHAREKGIIIADTKFEFGVDKDGNVVLADEMLTPDSSRFWPADEYKIGRAQKSYDKQYVRDWLKSNGLAGVTPAPELPEDIISATSEKYIEAYEILTGMRF